MFTLLNRRLAFIFVSLLLTAFVLGCAAPANTPTPIPPTSVPPTAAPPTNAPAAAPTIAPTNAPVSAPTDAPQSNPTAEPTVAPNADETVVLVVVPEKSEARYRVREQLAGMSLPNDAIGKTRAITGQIVGKMDGTIVSAESQFQVDVRTLRSDAGPRDNFIQRTPLQTSQFPFVTFVPTSAPGLPLIVPDSGGATFELVGELTIKDVTKPVTWQATCQLESNRTEGTCSATTTFTFNDFNLEQPRVARVLSIEDNITLEVDLFLQRARQ